MRNFVPTGLIAVVLLGIVFVIGAPRIPPRVKKAEALNPAKCYPQSTGKSIFYICQVSISGKQLNVVGLSAPPVPASGDEVRIMAEPYQKEITKHVSSLAALVESLRTQKSSTVLGAD